MTETQIEHDRAIEEIRERRHETNQLSDLRSKVADLSRKLIASEDELHAAQQKLDRVREIATDWSNDDCRPVQGYGDEILKALE